MSIAAAAQHEADLHDVQLVFQSWAVQRERELIIKR